MSYEKYLDRLKQYNILSQSFPHGSNIITKCRSCRPGVQQKALAKILPEYMKVFECLLKYEKGKLKTDKLVDVFDNYYEFVSSKEINGSFSHQSDFLSSIIPELVCSLLKPIALKYKRRNDGIYVTSQKDIIIECNFDSCFDENIILKKKRMDIAILFPLDIQINKSEIDFSIPIVCAEIKTNIDKNMLSGIESSVETLKRTFPTCIYYAIGEFSDFSVESLNYASTKIDEIFILRNQKRSESRRTPGRRNPLSKALINSFLEEVDLHLKRITEKTPSLPSRMRAGRLI